MASILVTGCEEDGTDQSANVASGLTFPRPPCAVCLRISRRVCTNRGGKDRLKNRTSPALRRSRVTLTRVLLRRDAYSVARRDFAARAQYAIRDSPRCDTTRRGHPCAISPTFASDLRLTCHEYRHSPPARDLSPVLKTLRN